MASKKNSIALALFILYLAAIGYCCFGKFNGIPGVGPTIIGIPIDKAVHFIMFFPFPILCFLAFDSRTNTPRRACIAVALAFITGCIVAAGTELGQSFISYRTGDRNDFIYDISAIAISSAITLVVDLAKMRKKS